VDVGGIGVCGFCRARGGGAVRPSKAKLLDQSRGVCDSRLSLIGQRAAGRPSARPIAVSVSERGEGRGCRRGRALRLGAADSVGVRRPDGRGRAGQRRLCGRGCPGWPRDEPHTVRFERDRRGGRAADHGYVRGRTRHVAGGDGQPPDNRRTVDGGEEVRDHGGGHVRVRPPDDRLPGQSVRGTVRQGIVGCRQSADHHRLFRVVRCIVRQ